MNFISVNENAVTSLDAQCLQLYLILKVALDKNNPLPGFNELRKILSISHDALKMRFSKLRIRGFIIIEGIKSYEDWNTESFSICITEQSLSVSEIIIEDESFIPFIESLKILVTANKINNCDRETLNFIDDIKAIGSKILEVEPDTTQFVEHQNLSF